MRVKKNLISGIKLFLPVLSVSLAVFFTFPAIAASKIHGNILKNWELSRVINGDLFHPSIARYPSFFQINSLNFQPVDTAESGLVKIACHRKNNPDKTDAVFARTLFQSRKEQNIELTVTYRGEITVFLNRQKVFFRPPSKNKPIEEKNMTDTILLKPVKGINEIFLMVKEVPVIGWEFSCRTNPELPYPTRSHHRAAVAWETDAQFLTPESVLYDIKREILYVTNMDKRFRMSETDEKKFTGYISRLKTTGKIETEKWVTHLHAPCGMAINGDKLYAIERRTLAEIDIRSGELVKRHSIPGKYFLNDLAIDTSGNIYISDTSPSAKIASPIYRFKNGQVEEWLLSENITRANGLFIHNDELLVGCSGDCTLKAVNLNTKKIRTVAFLGSGVVDGIRVDNKGNYLVSIWEGHVYSISPSGDISELINAIPLKINTADFEFINTKNLLVIPTFYGNKTVSYTVK